MKKIVALTLIGLLASFSMVCSAKKGHALSSATINLALTSMPQANKYANLEYGIRLNVRDGRANQRLIQVYDGASTTQLPASQAYPNLMSFIPESVRRYMRTMGLNLDADMATDYLLQMNVLEFHVDYLSGIGWCGTAILSVEVSDHNRTLVYPNVEVEGRATQAGSPTDVTAANTAMNNAYANALADIDWDRVAFFLHRSKSEKASKKEAENNSMPLDQVTVHFNIDSRPRGADIYWRVVSQTPEVKNQPYKYLQTTDYESTETLNIKGLTRDNASNVQIEIKVEKDNYYPKSTKLSVLSLIDDNDVSKMFKLVPMEEE